MRTFICVIIMSLAVLMLSPSAKAGVLAGVGTSLNYQLAPNGQSYETLRPLAFRAGYRFSAADIFLEYSFVSESSGNAYVAVGNTQHDLLLWAQHAFAIRSDWFRPFVAAALGAHDEVISTHFNGADSSDTGDLLLVAAFAAGAKFQLTKQIEIAFEGRATASEAYNPNPMLGAAASLVFAF